MKKNKMMRLASSLLVAVLLTSSVISGTFAKYVTEKSASDTARVAKFGVELTASGSLFESTYATNDTTISGDTDGLSVKSIGDDVVAPGTKNETGIVFTVSGTPEVDVVLEVEYTSGDYDSDVHLGDYYPIEYSLWQKKNGEGSFTQVITDKKLSDFKSEMTTLLNEKYVDAGETLEDKFGEFKITWKWDFDNGKDTEDTTLGNLADAGFDWTTASMTKPADGTYNLKTGINFTIRVTQVD